MRPTTFNSLVTTAIRVLPWLLHKTADALQWQARRNLAQIARVQQATIWLDRTTCELRDVALCLERRNEPTTRVYVTTGSTAAQEIKIDWK